MPWHEIALASKPIEIPKGDEVLPAEAQYLKTTVSWQPFLIRLTQILS